MLQTTSLVSCWSGHLEYMGRILMKLSTHAVYYIHVGFMAVFCIVCLGEVWAPKDCAEYQIPYGMIPRSQNSVPSYRYTKYPFTDTKHLPYRLFMFKIPLPRTPVILTDCTCGTEERYRDTDILCNITWMMGNVFRVRVSCRTHLFHVTPLSVRML